MLTVAHRLRTVMKSDKILVIDEGRNVEYGEPKELIERGGYFSKLVGEMKN